MASLVDRIFERTVGGLTRQLDLTWKRNEILASNIANAETPQYRAKDLHFAGALERAFGAEQKTISKTDARHLDLSGAEGTPHTIEDLSGVTKPDGNNVDIDLQMGRLAFNAGKFSVASNLVRKQLTIYRNAIRDGAR